MTSSLLLGRSLILYVSTAHASLFLYNIGSLLMDSRMEKRRCYALDDQYDPMMTATIYNLPSSMSWIANARRSKPPLMELPAELRDRIFYYILGGNIIHVLSQDRRKKMWFRVCKVEILGGQPYEMRDNHDHFHSECLNEAPRLDLSFNYVSKEIYQETQHLFWRYNKFIFALPSTLETFTSRLGGKGPLGGEIQMIRHLHLQMNLGNRSHWCDALNLFASMCSHVSTISINVYIPGLDSDERLRSLVQGVERLLAPIKKLLPRHLEWNCYGMKLNSEIYRGASEPDLVKSWHLALEAKWLQINCDNG